MEDKNSGKRKIEFKKSSTVRLKKYFPQGKTDKINIVNYSGSYDYKKETPQYPADELFI